MYAIEDIEELNAVVSRVLIAADKSPVIMEGADYVSRVFPHAKFHVVSVVNTTDRAIVLTGEYEEVLEKMSRESVKTIERILRKNGVNHVEKSVIRGRPSSKILYYARNVRANMIVIATHSKTGTQALTLGRTSRNVIEKTKIPILIFTPFSRSSEPKTLLNPSSGSKYSFKASMLSVRLAHAMNASVKTLYIGRGEPGQRFKTIAEYADKMGVKYTIQKVKGNAGDVLVKESKRADLMVVSRGRPGIGYKFRFLRKELALGKIEREVLALAEVPILLIP
jgi:nucleotide-binding universal stress UspA family protein